MRSQLRFLATIAAFGAAGCSSPAAGILSPTGTDAGLLVRVVAIVRDSTGYSVQFQLTNQDKTTLVISPSCDWRVDMLENNAWTVLGLPGGCDLEALGLAPGQTIPGSVHVRTAQALASGTELRVAMGWDRNQESVSEPTTVN